MNLSFEENLYQQGYHNIAGCDEAGRGPMAGPIVAAAVILGKDFAMTKFASHINDSKKLSEKKRLALRDYIIEHVQEYTIVSVDNYEIDTIGIGEANRECVRRAVQGLCQQPHYIAFDYVACLQFDTPYVSIKKGDATVLSIAAASILAKVHRDELMAEYDKEYPEYLFGKHKGYGTQAHRRAIEQYGLCPIHRKSFTFNN